MLSFVKICFHQVQERCRKHVSDCDKAVEVFKKAKLVKKRISGDWIPKLGINLQKNSLGTYFMKLSTVITEFRAIIRHFIGKSGQFGKDENGQCFWDTSVSVQSLTYSVPVLKRVKYRDPCICLSKVLDWNSITSSNLSNQPAGTAFRFNFK